MLCAFSIMANAQAPVQHTPNGTQLTIFTHNTGEKIKLNDVLTLQVIQKTDKDSVFFNSYATGQTVKLQVQPSQSITDLMELFPYLTLGDSVLAKVPTDSVFKNQPDKRPPFLPVGSNINFIIKVLRVQSLNDAIAERNTEIAKTKADDSLAAIKYIADNKLVVKTTASGLKYEITKLGLKPKPLTGDTVFVNYAGRLLNGKVFDSSIQAIAVQAGLNQPGRTYEPISFVLGKDPIIKGWEQALLLINEGGKATLVIPPSLAYGDQGGGDVIPPYSTLVFDVEITKVKRIKHAPPVPAKKPVAKKHYPASH